MQERDKGCQLFNFDAPIGTDSKSFQGQIAVISLQSGAVCQQERLQEGSNCGQQCLLGDNFPLSKSFPVASLLNNFTPPLHQVIIRDPQTTVCSCHDIDDKRWPVSLTTFSNLLCALSDICNLKLVIKTSSLPSSSPAPVAPAQGCALSTSATEKVVSCKSVCAMLNPMMPAPTMTMSTSVSSPRSPSSGALNCFLAAQTIFSGVLVFVQILNLGPRLAILDLTSRLARICKCTSGSLPSRDRL